MGKIRTLAPDQAQKIAAGEVVERPANVLKELLENAIDAQASKITVHIKDGGKQLIRVLDNGCGMSPEDAQLCFEQHATSKITCIDELQYIKTFGFRGEALASISAVSKTTLVAKEQSAEQGIKIERANGMITDHIFVPATTGTDIRIHELFYNIPARKKFLKTRETEWRQIQQLFFAFCLAHIGIDFKLYSEDKLVYNCPATPSLLKRFAQLFESQLAQQMIPIDQEYPSMKIEGIISQHHIERYDRNGIYLFVNNRWIKDVKLTRALIKGYQNVLPPGRFPVACIFITIDSTQVDINIHPRKEEVQFLHPRKIQQHLQQLVTKELEQELSKQLRKTVQFKPSVPLEKPKLALGPQKKSKIPFHPFGFDAFIKESDTQTKQSTQLPLEHKRTIKDMHLTAMQSQEQTETQTISFVAQNTYQLIGQYHKTYLLLETEDGLLLIDQHAAHERVLFEQLCKQEMNEPVALLFPQVITLTAQECSLLAEHIDLFKYYGIELEPFGDTTIKIQAIPVQMKNIQIDELIRQTISWIDEYKELDQVTFKTTIQQKMYAHIACKAAIKAGDTLTLATMQQLLDDLQQVDNRFTCPHGRPTSWLLHHDEIKKKFKRDYRAQRDTAS